MQFFLVTAISNTEKAEKIDLLVVKMGTDFIPLSRKVHVDPEGTFFQAVKGLF